jgi:hypothetical protein
MVPFVDSAAEALIAPVIAKIEDDALGIFNAVA